MEIVDRRRKERIEEPHRGGSAGARRSEVSAGSVPHCRAGLSECERDDAPGCWPAADLPRPRAAQPLAATLCALRGSNRPSQAEKRAAGPPPLPPPPPADWNAGMVIGKRDREKRRVRGAGRRRPWSADRRVLEAPDGGPGAAKQEARCLGRPPPLRLRLWAGPIA